jgi:NAD(P)H-hydrate repair Nnr-like enzyme with NAD(P)H-hydrate dehydratase domain
MANMLGIERDRVDGDPFKAATDVSNDLNVVAVMKGSRTFICSPDGGSWIYNGGTVGLATSGSGDVLAGIVAALLARGANPTQAAIWAVYLHGEAGSKLATTIGSLGFLAREIPAQIPNLMATISNSAANPS